MEVLPGCDPLRIIMDIGWSIGGMLNGWVGLFVAMAVAMWLMVSLRGIKPHLFISRDDGMYEFEKDGNGNCLLESET